MATAFLFLGHRNTPSIRQAYKRLQLSAENPGDVYWIYDSTNAPPAPGLKKEPLWTFSLDLLNSTLQYPFGIPHIVPGYAHAPIILFAQEHPEYENFWVIEYDVQFEGEWHAFFESTGTAPADLLTTHVRTYRENPDWEWWDHLQHPTRHIPHAKRLASFNPIYRISRDALSHLHEAHQRGWTGHNEVVLPTLLIDGGFRVRDLNGTGVYGAQVREPLYNRQTMRWRPPKWSTSEPNMLHHPIKPIGWILRYYYRQYCRKVGQCAGRIRTVLGRVARKAKRFSQWSP
jgi:hypothetical protein